MQQQAKNDWKRAVSLLAILLSIAALCIVVFKPSNVNAVTGSFASIPEPFITQPWLTSLVALVVFAVAAFTLFKLNR